MGSKKKKVAKKTPRLSPEAFIRTWQSCKSADESRARLGRYASNRASSYRKKGVPLKRFSPAGRRLDYKALAALVAK